MRERVGRGSTRRQHPQRAVDGLLACSLACRLAVRRQWPRRRHGFVVERDALEPLRQLELLVHDLQHAGRRDGDVEDPRHRRTAQVEVGEDDPDASSRERHRQVGGRDRLALLLRRARDRDHERLRLPELHDVRCEQRIGVAEPLCVPSDGDELRPLRQRRDRRDDRRLQQLLHVALRPDTRVEQLAQAADQECEDKADRSAEERVPQRVRADLVGRVGLLDRDGIARGQRLEELEPPEVVLERLPARRRGGRELRPEVPQRLTDGDEGHLGAVDRELLREHIRGVDRELLVIALDAEGDDIGVLAPADRRHPLQLVARDGAELLGGAVVELRRAREGERVLHHAVRIDELRLQPGDDGADVGRRDDHLGGRRVDRPVQLPLQVDGEHSDEHEDDDQRGRASKSGRDEFTGGLRHVSEDVARSPRASKVDRTRTLIRRTSFKNHLHTLAAVSARQPSIEGCITALIDRNGGGRSTRSGGAGRTGCTRSTREPP